MVELKKRCSAVLMGVSSLPGPYGIGGFGDEFKSFIDFLSACGFSAMQVLPFNLPDFGNSPYGSCSAFAGNYLFIDPVGLRNMSLLTEEELKTFEYGGSPFTVDYEFVLKSKKRLLQKAFSRINDEVRAACALFSEANSWVSDYALYMALKEKYGYKPWQQWEPEHKNYQLAVATDNCNKNLIDYYVFEQYIFDLQYSKIKSYAAEKSVAIIGDIPIYVALDSVDVWKNPKLFDLNDEFLPNKVAGVPPDSFSEDGQLWGNPVYIWDEHKKEGYEWWLSRIDRTLSLYDLVRIDHFRGFASYYTVDADAKNARDGEWKCGPGEELFSIILNKYNKGRIIAEDLGTYGSDVSRLLSSTGIAGMRVIQFGFDGEDSPHLPHNYPENSIAYVGTHDNNTLLGWLWEVDDEQRRYILDYCGFSGNDWGQGGYYSPSCRSVVEAVWRSAASVAVIPFQDLCGFGNDARMNIPGVPKDNWRFRTTDETIAQVDMDYWKKINKLYFR